MSESTIDVNALGEKIVRVLKTIFDPEIPVDIYCLLYTSDAADE